MYSLGENEVNLELLGDEGNDWKLLTGCVNDNLGINGDSDRSRDSVINSASASGWTTQNSSSRICMSGK